MTSAEDTPKARKTGARRRPRLRVFVLLFFFLGLITFLAGELVVRTYLALRGWTANCYAAQLEMYVPDADTGATLRKNFVLRSGTFHITTNSLGLRGADVPTDKPDGTLRIAVVGGSSAFGYFASDGQEAAQLLEDALNHAGHPTEVINAGVPGYNLFQTIPRYRNLVAPLHPDIVIVYLGWNDLTYVVSEDPTAEVFTKRVLPPVWERTLGHSALYGFLAYRVLQRTPNFVPRVGMNKDPTSVGAEEFRKNIESLIVEIEQSGARPIIFAQVMAAHPEAPPEVHMYLGTSGSDIEKVIVLGSWLRTQLETVALEYSLTFIDANSTISPTVENLGDAIHLTLTGEEKMGELWKSAVLDEINEADHAQN